MVLGGTNKASLDPGDYTHILTECFNSSIYSGHLDKNRLSNFKAASSQCPAAGEWLLVDTVAASLKAETPTKLTTNL